MKLKIRQHDASTPSEDSWSQTGDWLAKLRDDDRTKPLGGGHAGPGSASDPWPEALAQADALAEATVRAVIGDQLRMPIMWCEIGSCISWHADPAALGEADTRARAIEAGWRIDALGRLACPRCQQTDAGFWVSCPVVPWDRYTAIARAARAAAVPGDGTTGSTAWGQPRSRLPSQRGHRTAVCPYPRRPAAPAMPVSQPAGERHSAAPSATWP